MFNQLKSLFQIPGAKRKAAESQAQQQAIQNKLSAVNQPPAPFIGPLQTAPAPPIVPTQTAPAPAVVPPVNPQSQAIQSALGGLETQTKELQANLAAYQQAQPQTQAKEEPLRKAEEAIIAAQGITPEEQTAEQQLSNLIASREMGLQAVSEKPIAMEFITGQKSAIERRASAQALPLQARLAALQTKRQASLDVAKTTMDIEKARLERAKPNEEKIDEYTNEKGERVVAFRDKTTGKIRTEALGKVQPKELSQTEKDRAIKVEVIKRARPALIASRGDDGYVDPNVYLEMRSNYAETIGNPTNFDDVFSLMLSPQERVRLFTEKSVPTARSTKKDEEPSWVNE